MSRLKTSKWSLADSTVYIFFYQKINLNTFETVYAHACRSSWADLHRQ